MARIGKSIRSPLRSSYGGIVPDVLDGIPRKDELHALFARWVVRSDDALPRFATAVNEYLLASRDARKLPSTADERADLLNLSESIADVLKRLDHFPFRSEPKAHIEFYKLLAMDQAMREAGAEFARLDVDMMNGEQIAKWWEAKIAERAAAGSLAAAKWSEAHGAMDFDGLLRSIRVQLRILDCVIARITPPHKLKVGHRPKSRNSTAMRRLEMELRRVLTDYEGPAASAEKMAAEVARLVNLGKKSRS